VLDGLQSVRGSALSTVRTLAKSAATQLVR